MPCKFPFFHFVFGPCRKCDLNTSARVKTCGTIRIDNQYIYDSLCPSYPLYAIQDTLNAAKPGFGSFATTILKLNNLYGDNKEDHATLPTGCAIYKMSRSWESWDSMFLRGQQNDVFSEGYFRFKKRMGIHGLAWVLEHHMGNKATILLHCRLSMLGESFSTKYKWEDGNRRLIAMESVVNEEQPLLEIMVGLNPATMDLLVSTWAMRIAHKFRG